MRFAPAALLLGAGGLFLAACTDPTPDKGAAPKPLAQAAPAPAPMASPPPPTMVQIADPAPLALPPAPEPTPPALLRAAAINEATWPPADPARRRRAAPWSAPRCCLPAPASRPG